MPLSLIKDTVRTLFKVRQRRTLPPVLDKPAFGSTIVLDKLKIQLRLTIDHEQWEWLTLRGWRTTDMRIDRRKYYKVPSKAVARLLHASAEEREDIHLRILEHKYDKKHLG